MKIVPEVLVDPRQGSSCLYDHLQRRGIPARLSRLESADVSIRGLGPCGEILVGVERKTFDDLVHSMISGRLQYEQIPAMMRSYGAVWVVVEGIWRRSDAVNSVYLLDAGSPRWVRTGSYGRMTRDLAYRVSVFLVSLSSVLGVGVWRTVDLEDTADFVASLVRFYSKRWSDHRAGQGSGLKSSGFQMWRSSLVRRVAAQLDGIGWARSKHVEESFSTVEEMVLASEERWRQVEGVGERLAARIWKSLRDPSA